MREVRMLPSSNGRLPRALPWAEGSQPFRLKTHRCRDYGLTVFTLKAAQGVALG